eukprot:189670_1
MTIHPAAIIGLVVWLLIFVPIVGYNIHCLWLRKHRPYFQKRDPVTLFILICFLSFQYWRMIFTYEKRNCEISLLPVCDIFTAYTSRILDTITLDGLYITMMLRVWLLYFNVRWSRSITNMCWHKHINEQQATNNFFLKYKQTLGSFKTMKWIAAIMYISMIAVSIFVLLMDESSFGKYNGAKLVITSIFQFIILSKAHNDVWLIRKECGIQLLIWISTGLYFGVTVPLQLSERYIQWTIISQYASFIGCLLMICVAVLYPMRHFERISDSQQLAIGQCSWTEFVNHSEDHFDIFMLHMQREWSQENLLFIIEILQWKQYHKSQNNKKQQVPTTIPNVQTEISQDEKQNNEFCLKLKLPKNMPKSRIVHGSKSDDGAEIVHTPMEQFMLLYDKYICWNAPLEINISFESRSKIELFLNEIKSKENSKDIVFDISIFDSCLFEITLLIGDSWKRFITNSKDAGIFNFSNITTSNSVSSATSVSV